jgi:2-(1,2-epoxy-1,2-dihydrophenyl)acetyl-CoA isomerase
MTENSDEAPVRLENRNGVAWLVLNRPDRLNALNSELVELSIEAVAEVSKSPALRCLVITGSGRGFCSGADTAGLFSNPGDAPSDGNYLSHERMQSLTSDIFRLGKPTVAAINGPAVGAGFEFTLVCDFRIMTTDAYFMEAAMRHGLVPGDGSVFMLPRLVGMGRAVDVLISGRRIGADEALRWGMASEVVQRTELEAHVQELAERLGRLQTGAVDLLKQGIRYGLGGPDLESMFSYLRLAVAQGKTDRSERLCPSKV